MNSSNTNPTLDEHFGFVDAISSAISQAIQMIELAVIATCSGLGFSGLEFAIGISAFTSIAFEFIGVLFTRILGCSRALLFCVAIKIFALIALFFAVLCAHQGATTYAWVLIVIESIISSIAIGGIIAAYRPAYGLWYQVQSGQSLDMLQTYAHGRIVRSMGPIVMWVIAFILVKGLATSSPEIVIPTMLLSIAVTLRVAQFILYQKDLRQILSLDRPKVTTQGNPASIIKRIGLIIHRGIFCLKLVFKHHYRYAFYYMYGNIFFLIMVTYLLGEISRKFVYQGSDYSMRIMLGMLAGLLVSFFSSFIGAKCYPMLTSWAKLKTFHAIVMTTAAISSVILVCSNGVISILALCNLTLAFSLIGVGINRYVSTALMRTSETDTQSIFFGVVELVSSVLWLAMMLGLAVFDNHSVGISSMVMLFAAVGIILFLSIRQLEHGSGLESVK